MSNLLIKTK